MGDAARQLSDRLHLLRLGELGLECALLGGFDGINDGRLAVALVLLDRGNIEPRRAAALAGKRGIDRSDIALTVGRPGDRYFEPAAVALGHDAEDRSALGRDRLALDHALEEPGERRIGALDLAGF